MISESAKIPLRVRVKSLVQKLGDHLSLNVKGSGCNIHHMCQSLKEVLLILCEVCHPGQVDRNHTDRTCTFAASEEAARFLSKLPQIKS